jgi:hypothetical protein
MKVTIGKWNSATMGQETRAMCRQMKTRETAKQNYKARSRLDKKIMKKDKRDKKTTESQNTCVLM